MPPRVHAYTEDQLVEQPAVTPDKKTDIVRVKKSGNFGHLIVVKITNDFQFGARMVHRRTLTKGDGNFATISWAAMIAGEKDQEIHKNFPIKKVQPKGKAV